LGLRRQLQAVFAGFAIALGAAACSGDPGPERVPLRPVSPEVRALDGNPKHSARSVLRAPVARLYDP
jgi:hypothetical protein